MSSNDTARGKVRFFDDFTNKAFNSTNDWNVNTDGGTTPAITLALDGLLRIVGDGTDGDIDTVVGQVIYRASAGGPLICEWRIVPRTSVADGEYFIGLTDATTDETSIQVSTADAQTDAATDAVGFCYTGAGTANWKACAVKAGASSTPVACNKTHTTDAGVMTNVTTPVVGTFQTFKIVINEDGDADFYINGSWQARIDNAVTATTLLAPAVGQETGGTARGFDVDYCFVECARS